MLDLVLTFLSPPKPGSHAQEEMIARLMLWRQVSLSTVLYVPVTANACCATFRGIGKPTHKVVVQSPASSGCVSLPYHSRLVLPTRGMSCANILSVQHYLQKLSNVHHPIISISTYLSPFIRCPAIYTPVRQILTENGL